MKGLRNLALFVLMTVLFGSCIVVPAGPRYGYAHHPYHPVHHYHHYSHYHPYNHHHYHHYR